MHKVLIPYFLALCVTPSTHTLEGTLLVSWPCLILIVISFTRFHQISSKLVQEMVISNKHRSANTQFVILGFRFFLSVTSLLLVFAGRDLNFDRSTYISRTSIFYLLSAFPVPSSLSPFSLQARFSIALRRLTLPNGILYSEDTTRYQVGRLKTE
ncbi:protein DETOXIFICATION 46, chloroplastic-like [Olea europaea var. sylvestris]|uniref:protein DETOXIFICATION 46, chloroplastic-like n=1 Tax=Olea europaea var. sylvestris TaxID=158386 RepID=UPI000C1D0581|nr:protein DETOXIFICATION 46, chloroplastic-like [Olea europaea var. sylvestris]